MILELAGDREKGAARGISNNQEYVFADPPPKITIGAPRENFGAGCFRVNRWTPVKERDNLPPVC